MISKIVVYHTSTSLQSRLLASTFILDRVDVYFHLVCHQHELPKDLEVVIDKVTYLRYKATLREGQGQIRASLKQIVVKRLLSKNVYVKSWQNLQRELTKPDPLCK